MEFSLQRCIHLARQGGNRVFPNPQVGSVIVHEGRIIGEGFHAQYGGPHGEVAAVNNVQDKDKQLLSSSTLYVNLEPCNHYGKTPPCTELILKHRIPKVVVGCLDPNPRVAGKGVERLRAAGVEVILAENPKSFERLNAPFFTNHRHKRPHIILKWAQSADGFIATKDELGNLKPTPITAAQASSFVHKLRARHHAIMVGKHTAVIDNPRLNTRKFYGDSPIRLVFDKDLTLPKNLNLFSDGAPTIILNRLKDEEKGSLKYIRCNEWENLLLLMEKLYQQAGICSILVEGGTNLLQQFIDQDFYDEIYRFKAPQKYIADGLKAPILPDNFLFDKSRAMGKDILEYFIRE